MTQQDKRKQDKRQREKHVVGVMIRLYCKRNHREGGKHLCSDCAALLDYAHARVDACPFMETKTFCNQCKVHCYRPQQREKIRAIMRWSGPRMLFVHPVLAVRHLIETKKAKRQNTKE